MSDVDSKIKQYVDKFKEIKMVFQERASLQTVIIVSRIIEVVGELLHLVCNFAAF